MSDVQAAIAQLQSRLTELEGRIAIRDLVSDYCHGFDKRDYARFLAIWWEDCVWDIGPPLAGLKDTMAFMKRFTRSCGPSGTKATT